MRVQRVVMRDSEEESWTLLAEDHGPVEPVERFLSYFFSIEKFPNTVKAYAHDLKDWFTYLADHGLEWRRATLEDVAGFVAWLRLSPEARAGKVAMLPTVEHYCSASSVNRKRFLAVSSGFGDQVRVVPAWRVDEGGDVSLAA
jgi:integrase/recombinase XerD